MPRNTAFVSTKMKSLIEGDSILRDFRIPVKPNIVRANTAGNLSFGFILFTGAPPLIADFFIRQEIMLDFGGQTEAPPEASQAHFWKVCSRRKAERTAQSE